MTDTTPRYGPAVDAAITGLLTQARGKGAMKRRPIRPGSDITATVPADPLEGLRAAIGLYREVRGRIRDYARYAREDGCSWEEIGRAMDRAPDPDAGVTVGVAAFEFVASDLGRGLSFGWTCPACLGLVIDYGPEAGHPEDRERGHAEGCTRLAETIAAWHQEDDNDG